MSTDRRILSGMRPTGMLHLGHYHGVLKNWLTLQHEYDCFFFVADWHALTTEYGAPEIIADSAYEMVVDWLAVGINPGEATLFVQSRIPEHAELCLLLSMMTPLGWLERVPTYKDQQEKLAEKDLSTYGFLGYPLLQAADILIYKAGQVPVGDDQVPHVELARNVARRFNHLYGREPGFQDKAEAAARKMGKKAAKLYFDLRKRYQEQGDVEALATARAFLESQHNIALSDHERLLGYLEGSSRTILPEPEALLAPEARLPGLDGEKMSKSYGNTIGLREAPEVITQKLRTMPTDPARVRRQDPGEPEKCPVWKFHQVYSSAEVKSWVEVGCRGAGIGCLDCKQPVIDAVLAELAPIRERALDLERDTDAVCAIIADGCEAARDVARETMDEVREAMGLVYR